MLVAELGKRVVEASELLETLMVAHRVLDAWHARKTVARKVAFLHGIQPAPGEAPLLVNKQVVHDAAKPGAWLVYLDQIVELAEGFDQQFLKQIFGLGFGTGKPPGEAVEAIEVRSHKSLKGQILFRGAHNEPECISTSRRNKDWVDSL